METTIGRKTEMSLTPLVVTPLVVPLVVLLEAA